MVISRAILVSLFLAAGTTYAQQGVLIDTLQPIDNHEDEFRRFGSSIDVSNNWIAIGTGSGQPPEEAYAYVYRHAGGTALVQWQIIPQIASFNPLLNDIFQPPVYQIAISDLGALIRSGQILFENPNCGTGFLRRYDYWIIDDTGDFVSVPPLETLSTGPFFCVNELGIGDVWTTSSPSSSPMGALAVEIGGEPTTLFSSRIAYNHNAETMVMGGVFYPFNSNIRDQKNIWSAAVSRLSNNQVAVLNETDPLDIAFGGLNNITTEPTDVAVSSDGRWVAVGFPDEVNPNTPGLPAEGLVRVYQRTPPNSSVLTLHQGFNASTVESLTAGSEFGFAVEIDGDALVISAPGQQIPGATLPGAIHTFKLVEGSGNCGAGSDCWVYQGGPGTNPLTIANPPLFFTGAATPFGTSPFATRYGETIDLNQQTLAVSVPSADVDNVNRVGIVQLFAVPGLPDCNGNGVADTQDINAGVEVDFDLDGVPDSCQVAQDPSLDCNGNGLIDQFELLTPVDIVFLFDTSMSMFDDGLELCRASASIRYELADLGIPSRATFYSMSEPNESTLARFPCVSRDLYTEECPDQGNTTGPNALDCQLMASCTASDRRETAGPASAIVARSFNWAANSRRILVPVTDTGPLCDSIDYDPSLDCSNPADRAVMSPQQLSICTAIDAAVGSVTIPDDDVIVIPYLGLGSDSISGLIGQMNDFADATNPTGSGTVVLAPNLPGLVQAIVDASVILPPPNNCNDNDTPDDCECLADVNADGQLAPNDLNAWVLAFSNQQRPGDQNCNGQFDPGDLNAFILNYNQFPPGPCPQ